MIRETGEERNIWSGKKRKERIGEMENEDEMETQKWEEMEQEAK
jgi:hypothetical protein